MFAQICIGSYAVFVLLGTFPAADQISDSTVFHVSAVQIITESISCIEFVAIFSIIMAHTDKRISGIHVTVLGSIYNLTQSIHSFYIFRLVDLFGTFYP